MLNELGYDAGPVDGVAGRRTVEALNAFRRNNGLAATDGIDQRSLATLRSIHAGTASRGELVSTPPIDYAQSKPPLQYGQPDIGSQAHGYPAGSPTTSQPSDTLLAMDTGTQASVSTPPLATTAPSENSQLTDLRRLSSLPSWLRSVEFAYHQGLPIATPETTSHIINLMGMATRPPDAGECNLIRDLLFTKEATQAYINKSGPMGCWVGQDEFQTKDSRRAFYERYREPLRQIAPRTPFRMVFVGQNSLGEFDAGIGGFRLKDHLATPLQRSLRLDHHYFYRLNFPTLRWPDAVLPADEARAREVLETIRVHTATKPASRSSFAYRTVQVVGIFDVEGIDFDTRRIDINLVSLRLYDPAFTQVLHEFKLPPRFDTFIRGDIPQRLNVPTPTPLNMLFLLSEYVARQPEGATKGWEALYSRLVERDRRFYSAIPNEALPPDDLRLPVFTPKPGGFSPGVLPQLRKWAAAYRAGASDIMVWDNDENRHAIGAIHGSLFFDFPIRASVGATESYRDILEAEGVLPEQVGILRWGAITTLAIAPNRLDMYGLEVPIDRGASKDTTPRTLFKRGEIKMATDTKGDPVLLIYIEPISLAAYRGDELVAKRTYEDVPRLDGSFVAQQALSLADRRDEAANAGETVIDLSPASLDLIVLKALGKGVSNTLVESMVARRWKSENSKEATAGQHFFVKGMREPKPEELADIAPKFREWVAHAMPDLPITLRAVTLTHPKRGSWLSWDALKCSASKHAQVDKRHSVTRSDAERADLDQMMRHDSDAKFRMNIEYGSQKRRGVHNWSDELEKQNAQLTLALASSDRIQRLGDLCGVPSDGSPSIFLEMQDSMPYSGQQADFVDLLIEVTGARMADKHPHYTDWLPQKIVAEYKLEPQVTLSGEAIILEARFKEAVYHDKFDREMDRIEPDPGTTRASMETVLHALGLEQEQVAAQIVEKTKGLDLVGVRLGMDMAEAETVIRAHMDVGRVLVGKRLHDGSFDEGLLAPATSGKMFISKDGNEVIAIYDEPPSEEKVLIVWRQVYMEPGSVQIRDIDAVLRQKYGDPSYQSKPMSNDLYKWRAAGNDVCLSNHGGQRNHPISMNWREESGEPTDVLLDGQPMLDSQIPTALFEPKHQSYSRSLNCGPVVSAYLDFQASRQMSFHGHVRRDSIEMYLTDIDAYLAAFEKNRESSKAKLAEKAPAGQLPSLGGLKF